MLGDLSERLPANDGGVVISVVIGCEHEPNGCPNITPPPDRCKHVFLVPYGSSFIWSVSLDFFMIFIPGFKCKNPFFPRLYIATVPYEFSSHEYPALSSEFRPQKKICSFDGKPTLPRHTPILPRQAICILFPKTILIWRPADCFYYCLNLNPIAPLIIGVGVPRSTLIVKPNLLTRPPIFGKVKRIIEKSEVGNLRSLVLRIIITIIINILL